jgi:regulator of replication initiation timing
MGLSDKEVRRVRQVVAELEAKNAELLEENLEMRKELEKVRRRLPLDSAERSPEKSVNNPGG